MPPRKSKNGENTAKVAKLYPDHTNKAISKMLGISESAVDYHARMAGLVKKPRVTQDEIAMMRDLRKEKLPYWKIAAIVGVSDNTARRYAGDV